MPSVTAVDEVPPEARLTVISPPILGLEIVDLLFFSNTHPHSSPPPPPPPLLGSGVSSPMCEGPCSCAGHERGCACAPTSRDQPPRHATQQKMDCGVHVRSFCSDPTLRAVPMAATLRFVKGWMPSGCMPPPGVRTKCSPRCRLPREPPWELRSELPSWL